MSVFTGSVIFLILIYYIWAMARPADTRPPTVRGPGAILIPVIILFLAWLGGR